MNNFVPLLVVVCSLIFSLIFFFFHTFPSLIVVRRAGATGHAVRWSADVH